MVITYYSIKWFDDTRSCSGDTPTESEIEADTIWKAGNFHVLVPQCRELLSGLVHLAKNTPGPKHHLEKSLEGCYGSHLDALRCSPL